MVFRLLALTIVCGSSFLAACRDGEKSTIESGPTGTDSKVTAAAQTPLSTPAPTARIAPFLDKCLVRAAEPPVMPVAGEGVQLMGIVVARGTADPVAGVSIVIAETGNATSSDERGHFFFSDLASDAEPVVRRTVYVDDAEFAEWEVRNLQISMNPRGLIVQVSRTEPFSTEHRTPEEIDSLGVSATSPLNSQPTALWETFKEVCDPWTGEPKA